MEYERYARYAQITAKGTCYAQFPSKNRIFTEFRNVIFWGTHRLLLFQFKWLSKTVSKWVHKTWNTGDLNLNQKPNYHETFYFVECDIDALHLSIFFYMCKMRNHKTNKATCALRWTKFIFTHLYNTLVVRFAHQHEKSTKWKNQMNRCNLIAYAILFCSLST